MTLRSLPPRLALAVASVGYAGYAPFAPGTVGSALAVPLWFALRWSGWRWAEPLSVVVLFFVGTWSARVAERELGVEDPGIVVIDEVVGLLVSVLWLPLTWQVALAGFVAFRFFDIVKPYPAGRMELVPGGWGVMLDDVMAGVYAWLVVRGMLWLKPEWFT